MDKKLREIILRAHEKSVQRAFETAVRTGTALVFTRDGKVVEEKPAYRYELVPITKTKRSKKS